MFRPPDGSVVVIVPSITAAMVVSAFRHVEFSEKAAAAIVIGSLLTSAAAATSETRVVALIHIDRLLRGGGLNGHLHVPRTSVRLMSRLQASVTNDVLLLLLHLQIRLRKIEGRMGEFARSAVRAKSDEIIDAEDASSVTMTARRTVPTKAPIVPRTVFDLGGRVDVLEGTFFVETSAELLVKVALGHFRHVVLVKKFAVIAFLAKSA